MSLEDMSALGHTVRCIQSDRGTGHFPRNILHLQTTNVHSMSSDSDFRAEREVLERGKKGNLKESIYSNLRASEPSAYSLKS